MSSEDKVVEDPYAGIRRDVPPPGKVIRSKKDYNRQNEKSEILRELKEFRDYIPKNVEIDI